MEGARGQVDFLTMSQSLGGRTEIDIARDKR